MNENLKITAKMRTPIAFVGMIHLDAILMSALCIREITRPFDDSAQSLVDKIKHLMPIEIVTLENGKSIYSASVGFAIGCTSVVRWKKRWDNKYEYLVDFKKKQAKIEHKRGYFKQYNMPLVILSTPEMVFYARGDKRRIESLLNHLSHIGKKSSQGFGEIREWKAESIEQDWSIWKDGQPMRAIPSLPQAGFLLQQTGYCFPYWDRRNQSVCIVPRLEYGSAQT